MAGDLIHNERTKLIANALDRASTSCVTVGVAAPLAGYVYGLNHFSPGFLAVTFVGWLGVAAGLHVLARIALGGLQS